MPSPGTKPRLDLVDTPRIRGRSPDASNWSWARMHLTAASAFSGVSTGQKQKYIGGRRKRGGGRDNVIFA